MTIENNSDAIRVLYRNFDLFDTAKELGHDESDSAQVFQDQRISENDLSAVVEGDGFTQEQKEAAQYLLENDSLRDGIDGADDDGNVDGIIGRDGIYDFIAANRENLEYGAVAVLDAHTVIDADGDDERLATLATRVEGLPENHRQTLLREIVRQDGEAPRNWLQGGRLVELLNDGEIDSATYEALADQMPTMPGHLPDPPEDTVRVTTFNIGQGASRGEGKGTDFDEIPDLATNIAASQSDVVLIQEAFEDDMGPLVENLQEEENRIAAAEGREPRTVHYTFSNADSSKEVRHEDGRHTINGGGFGNAVITYSEQTEIYGDNQLKLTDDGDEGRRVMGVQVEIDGETVTIFNTHLSSTSAPDSGELQDDRQATQLQESFDVVEQYGGDGPVIFGGDFNTATNYTRPSADVLNQGIGDLGLEDVGAEAGATSNYGFGGRIDYLLTQGFSTEGVYRMDAGSSDHAAVVADVKLNG